MVRYIRRTVITVERLVDKKCWCVCGEFDTRMAAEAYVRLLGDPGTYRVSRSWPQFVIDQRPPICTPGDGGAP